jgi:hypothetical protein
MRLRGVYKTAHVAPGWLERMIETVPTNIFEQEDLASGWSAHVFGT